MKKPTHLNPADPIFKPTDASAQPWAAEFIAQMQRVNGFRPIVEAHAEPALSYCVTRPNGSFYTCSREDIEAQTAAMRAEADFFPGVKVRCESPYWSRQLQLVLKEQLDCRWPNVMEMPWNTSREWLVVRQSTSGVRGWWLYWATEEDFAECEFPEYTAKGLVQASPGAPAAPSTKSRKEKR